MDNLVAVHQSNEKNANEIDNAWKNIFDTLDRKMLESDDVDAAATHEQVQENNNGINPPIVSSHPAIEFVPSNNYRLVEDSVGVDHTEDRSITVESIMEKENDLFNELSTVEHSALNYFKTYWTDRDKKSESAAASSVALSKPTESVSETIKNVEDSIEADFITTTDSAITKCPSVELIMERKENLFKKLSEIEHNMVNYFKNFRTKVKIHSELAEATTAVALTKKTESDSEIDIDNGSYVDVHPGRAQTVVQATFESTEKIAPTPGGDYEGGDCCSRNRGNSWTGNIDEFTSLPPLGMNNGHRNHDDNGDEKYCNERYYTESSVDDSSEQFEMSNGEEYLEIDPHHYAFSSTVENPNKMDHHQKSKFYNHFVDDDPYESMDEENPCSQNHWGPLDNSREQYETTNKTLNARKRTRYQQKVNHRSDYVDDNHFSNANINNNEDRDHCYYSFDDDGQQLIDEKPKTIKKCRRLTENINQ